MTLLNRKRILHPTKTPEDSKETRGRSDPRRADIVEPEEEEEEEKKKKEKKKEKKTKKDTRRDTGFRRETDTDSQYIDYSYTYNPICLRYKMHRFCPKDRVLLVTASLEERASEGGAAAVAAAALAYAPRADCRHRSSSSVYRNRQQRDCDTDPPRACVSIRRGSPFPSSTAACRENEGVSRRAVHSGRAGF